MSEPDRAALIAPHDCKHPRRKHTVWYWVEDGAPAHFGPMSASFDNLADALRFAESGVRQAAEGATQLRWIKVFRADNESYTCWRWENPDPWEPPAPPAPPVRAQKRRWWRRG